jgi:hypothetical protein
MKYTIAIVIIAVFASACIVLPPAPQPTAPQPTAVPRPTVAAVEESDIEAALRQNDFIYIGLDSGARFYVSAEEPGAGFAYDSESFGFIADFGRALDGRRIADLHWELATDAGLIDVMLWTSDHDDELRVNGGSAGGPCGSFYCYGDMDDDILVVSASR